MSKKGRDLTADEHKLWRRVASSVKPRRAKAPPAEETPSPPPTRTVQRTPPAQPPPVRRSAPNASPPQDRGGEKRVRRGTIEIGASLDLHGHTQDSARTVLFRFLRAAQARGDRTVVVITGAGRAGQGVLKQRLPEWLAQRDVRALLSGFAPAHRAHGGAGAFYVFLKRASSTRE